MHKKIKRIVVLSIGVLFIILGLVGLFLPFLQGFLFLAIGLILLSLYSTTVREWTEHHTRKYPKLHTIVKRAEDWVVGIIGRP